MNWKKRRFQNFKLYAVTDLKDTGPQVLQKIEDALRGGVDIIQLRSRVLSDNAFFRFGIQVRRLTNAHQALLAVNDRADLARAVGADILHLGQEDLPVRVARKELPPAMRIGKSTHSLDQALRAAREPVDYISIGPVFATPTKPTYEPVGLGLVRVVAAKIRKPLVAIGGIDLSNVGRVLQAGARRVAVVRAIFDAPHVEGAARSFVAQLTEREPASPGGRSRRLARKISSSAGRWA